MNPTHHKTPFIGTSTEVCDSGLDLQCVRSHRRLRLMATTIAAIAGTFGLLSFDSLLPSITLQASDSPSAGSGFAQSGQTTAKLKRPQLSQGTAQNQNRQTSGGHSMPPATSDASYTWAPDGVIRPTPRIISREQANSARLTTPDLSGQKTATPGIVSTTQDALNANRNSPDEIQSVPARSVRYQQPNQQSGTSPVSSPTTNGDYAPQQHPETLTVPAIPKISVPSLDEAREIIAPPPAAQNYINQPGSQPGNSVPEFDVPAGNAVAPEFDLLPNGTPESHHRSSRQSPLPTHRTGGFSSFGPAPGTSGFRATVEADAPQWMGSYMGRTDQMPVGSEPSMTPPSSIQIPRDYRAWWDSMVCTYVGIAPGSVPVDVSTLVQRALQCSPQVLALQAEPEVQQRVVWQEEAAFDWRAFLDTTYDDLNDPVGNTLTTGNNSDRLLDNKFSSSGGVRKRTGSGGEVSVAQRIGHQYNNSIFLKPNSQSTSRLELSFRQPLLGKAGTFYAQNQIVLARITTNTSSDEVLAELQTHLYRVTEAYWQLYRARAEFFQRQKLLTSARSTLQTLEGRNQVDTIPRQILRARAAVARAESRMQRAVTSIRNAESQLRLLVNDPEMLNNGPVEFTPTETPVAAMAPSGLRESLQTALVNRPDISKAIRQMRASSVRLGVSRNELLPKLDFLVKAYVAGLEAQNEIPQSIGNQFSEGGPGYTVGLEFEVPLGNRAAKARVEQRQWELQRSINVFRATVETSLTEVEVASREVETSWREMSGRFQAMTAAQNETNYLQDRFDVLPGAEDSTILLLEDLLDGYERLADEESAFVESQVNYSLSIIQLRRATGVLLRSRHEQPETLPTESDWMAQRVNESGTDSSSVRAKPAGFSTRYDAPPVSSVNAAAATDEPVKSSSKKWTLWPRRRQEQPETPQAAVNSH